MENYSTKEFLKAVDETHMPVSAKLIRDSLLQGTYPGVKSLMVEAIAPKIDYIGLIKEPSGDGVQVKVNGHEYRYAASDTHQKYNTPDKLYKAAQKLMQFRSHGAVLGWLDKNGILYFGSKTGKDKAYPTKEQCEEQKEMVESLSSQAMSDLKKLIKELHPEWDQITVDDAAWAFVEEFELTNDRDYYRIGPSKLRHAL